MAAIVPSIPTYGRDIGGLYCAHLFSNQPLTYIALFPTPGRVLYNGDIILFSVQDNASGTRHVEFVNADRCGDVPNQQNCTGFDFTFNGTKYTAILEYGNMHESPYPVTLKFWPIQKPNSPVEIYQIGGTYLGISKFAGKDGDGIGKDLRLWTGNAGEGNLWINAVVIAAEGIGAGLPFKFYGCFKKSFYQVLGTQNSDPQSPGTFSSPVGPNWIVQCKLSEETQELSLTVTENGTPITEKLAMIQEIPSRKLHHHDFAAPNPVVDTRATDFRSPQVSPALSRILDPMPFPSTLVETLTHTASYVDQAGYLAKYAVDRYAELDKAYHKAEEKGTASSKENKELKDKVASAESEIQRLADENKAGKDKIDALEKSLADARDTAAKREAELTSKIQELQNTVAKDQQHDEADHKALDDAQKSFKEEEAAKNELKKKLDLAEAKLVALQSDNDALTKRLQDMTKKYNDAAAEVSDLKGKLEAEEAENKQLKEDNQKMKDKLAALEKQLAAATKSLARAQEDLKQAQSDLSDNEGIIEGLEKGFAAMKKDRDGKKRALEELKKSTDETIKDLQDQITAAEAHDLEDHKKIVEMSDKLNAANAHDAEHHK